MFFLATFEINNTPIYHGPRVAFSLGSAVSWPNDADAGWIKMLPFNEEYCLIHFAASFLISTSGDLIS